MIRRLTIDVTATDHVFNSLSRPGSEDMQDDLIGIISEAAEVTLVKYEDVQQYTLHVGMHATEFLLADRTTWFTDSDGWNSWGEKPRTESNDKDTFHVMWHKRVTVTEADAIVESIRPHLRPMTTHRDAHVIAVLSDPNVWSEGQDRHWYDNVAGPQGN